MSGINGEVRGSSKPDVYRKYAAAVRDEGGVFLDHIPDAKFKKACKSQMKQDLQTGEWGVALPLADVVVENNTSAKGRSYDQTFDAGAKSVSDAGHVKRDRRKRHRGYRVGLNVKTFGARTIAGP
jgi:hypothetical protein